MILCVEAVVQFWIGRVEKEALLFRIEPSETVTLWAACGVFCRIGCAEEQVAGCTVGASESVSRESRWASVECGDYSKVV